MNYRHGYHAGNICDVVKHIIFLELVTHLHKKTAPYVVFDTHAGAGLYDLENVFARKTGEAEDGIRAFLKLQASPDFEVYRAILAKANLAFGKRGEITSENLRVYPGSPYWMAHCLRDQDRYVGAELHPEDYAALRVNFAENKQIQCHHRDGYEMLTALTPPPEKRGLVLIDPPYEREDEYERVVGMLRKAYRRWPGGIYALWYPIKDRPTVNRFHALLTETGIRKQLILEFIYADHMLGQLHGSGMIITNPPWMFSDRMTGIFSQLQMIFPTPSEPSKIAWLAEEW